MDWKYKHFHLERVFAAQRDEVLEAARTFMSESLGWQITNPADASNPANFKNLLTAINPADGFTAHGYSFTHRAIANLRFRTVADGTSVDLELMVERYGWRGYMLADVGGYYGIQMHKWLDGIQWTIHQKLTGSQDESANPLVLAANKPAAYIFNGCLVFILATFGIYALVTFISAVVGLLTGKLFLTGRRSLTIHGAWARVLSASILIFAALLGWNEAESVGSSQAQ